MMNSDIIIESCVETVDDSLNAVQNGAHQLEVCSYLSKDGLTPDIAVLSEILSRVKIPVKVMIRSREGNFFYTQEEIQQMISEIQKLKAYRVDGFVFGALMVDSKGKNILDITSIYQICKAASPYHVTIHKAIDLCHDMISEVKRLKQISNVRYILTSGGAADAISGQNMLKVMQKEAGNDINIIAAGKITTKNLPQLIKTSGLKYFHGRKIV